MPNHVTNRITFDCDEKTLREIYERFRYDKTEENEYHVLGTIDFNKVIPMPPSLNITSGSETDRGIEVYLTAKNPNVDWYGDENQKMDAGDFCEIVKVLAADNYTSCNTALSWEKLTELQNKPYAGNLEKYYNIGEVAVNNLCSYGATTWYKWRVDNWGTKWNSYNYEGKIGGADDNNIDGEIVFDTAWCPPLPIINSISRLYPDIPVTIKYADEDIGNNCGEITFLGGEIINEYEPDEGSREAYEFAAEVKGVELSDYNLYLNKDGSNYEYRNDDFSDKIDSENEIKM